MTHGAKTGGPPLPTVFRGLCAPFPPTPFSRYIQNREIYLVNPSVYMGLRDLPDKFPYFCLLGVGGIPGADNPRKTVHSARTYQN
jgi:hypothetical protein